VSEAVLDIVSVVKDYQGLRPLRIERLSLAPGDQVALIGMDAPAAEMMTTLVTGAALPDTGTIQVVSTATAGLETSDDWLRLVDKIGLVTDRAALLDMMTVEQNLALSFTLDIEPPPEDVRQRVAALATEVGLPEDTWRQPVAELDGTGRARVRLARAIALGPSLLLLEHPTAQVGRPDVAALGHDIRAVVHRRQLTTLAMTADFDFVDAMGLRAMNWEPATGRVHERKRGWWPWRSGPA
jgi:ABC-type transporter Mla maintaining outer membrane lipid asymmetry ATPase subunit MlaF